MKTAFRYFWVVFVLYFIFLHPAIIYYAGGTGGNQFHSPFFFYLSAVLWLFIFILVSFYVYKITFQAQKQIGLLLRSGQRLEGKIITSENLNSSQKNLEQKDLAIEMENLKGEKIKHQMVVLDSKPWEKRFEAGNNIIFRIDPAFRQSPSLILEAAKTKINYRVFVILGVFILGIIGYYLYVYQTEGLGESWSFFGPWHPVLISAYCALLFFAIGSFVVGKFLGGFSGKKKAKLKFAGRKTTAKVLKVMETGTRINNQPLVKFELEYTDQSGRTYKNEIKQILSILEIAQVNQSERIIFYLEEDPLLIAFEEDLIQVS